MALFTDSSPQSDGSSSGDPRIRGAGRWPVRVTDFYLSEPYDQPPVDYLEVFYVRAGSFLHESEAGKQTLREGSLIVSHPGNRQVLKNPEDCHLTRVRFLPEWLTADFHSLIRSDFTIAAITGKQLFDLPDRDSIFVFSASEEHRQHLVSDLDLLRSRLTEGDAIGVLTRATLVKFLPQVGDEFGRFLRHRGGLALPPEFYPFFDEIEFSLGAGDPPSRVAGELIAEEKAESFERLFKKATGLSPEDYLLRRRLDHAAHRLLVSEDRTKVIATAVGFYGTADMTKNFENRYRLSPTVYRQKYSPPPEGTAPRTSNGNGNGTA